MFLFRVGKRIINLAHLVQIEELGTGDDAIRITMIAGKEFDEVGDEARRLIRQADAIASHPFPSVVISSAADDEETPMRGKGA